MIADGVFPYENGIFPDQDRAIETLVHNGQLPGVQEVIAGCGYTPEVLQQTETL